MRSKNVLNIAILILCFTRTISYGQSGYFGSKNGLGISLNVVPITHYHHQLDDSKQNLTIKRKLAYTKFDLHYTRIIHRKVSVNLGYKYNKGYTNHPHTLDETFTISIYEPSGFVYEKEYSKEVLAIQSLPFTQQHLYANFNFFRRGSRAPAGKYFGLGIATGWSKINSGEILTTGTYDAASERNFFQTNHSVLSTDEHLLAEMTYRYAALNVIVGRSYPLTKFLTLNFSLTCPLYSFDIVDGQTEFPGILDYWIDAFDFDYGHPGSNNLPHPTDILTYPSFKTSRLSIDFGFTFFI